MDIFSQHFVRPEISFLLLKR